jgi:hypothetical protein
MLLPSSVAAAAAAMKGRFRLMVHSSNTMYAFHKEILHGAQLGETQGRVT